MSNSIELERAGGGSWHLDKRVNISIIGVLLTQIIVGAWQVSKMDSRVGAVEEKVATLQRYGEADRQSIGAMREDLREIKTMLKVMADKGK
jgi:hypothetical protein